MKVLFLIASLLLLGSCQITQFAVSPTGLESKTLKKGKGPQAVAGDAVMLFETTSYRDGTVLYSNEGSTQPIKITLGAGQVTDAVEEGLQGMRAGEEKLIVAPPNLVRRTMYPDNVSPDSTLVIKLIVVEVVKG